MSVNTGQDPSSRRTAIWALLVTAGLVAGSCGVQTPEIEASIEPAAESVAEQDAVAGDADSEAVEPTAVPPTAVPPEPEATAVPSEPEATAVPSEPEATAVPPEAAPSEPPAAATISFDDVPVLNLLSGETESLASFSPSGPALLWFWAPH